MRPLALAKSVALQGMAATIVEVEAAIGGGLPATTIVGLPDSSINEAKQRCRSAVTAMGMQWPTQLLTINLSPATLPKRGSHYDLAMIAAIWAAQNIVPQDFLRKSVLLGELSLNGSVRKVQGLLAAVLGARQAGVDQVVVPASQYAEANLVTGITVWPVDNLLDLLEVLRGNPVCIATDLAESEATGTEVVPDLADVMGQPGARWALEVAAAGRHHLLMVGPPGCGKTMLAERLPGILPDLSVEEAIEAASVKSLAMPEAVAQLNFRPPFSAPHPNSSVESVIGGGTRLARPGAVSLAHRGCLFMDEAPEFNRRTLEALRVPLESGKIVLGRAGGDVVYPAFFQLIMAANPCPCGLFGLKDANCRCAPARVHNYLHKISGPILDRIDIQQRLTPLSRSFVATKTASESTSQVKERVLAARDRQRRRLADTPWLTNGEVPGAFLRRSLPSPADEGVLDAAVERGKLSGRGIDKVLRVAWTLADLDGRDKPLASHVRTALAMRQGVSTGMGDW